MDKKIRNKWVKALESNKYEQGTGTLLRNNRYCCLGVLCNILNPKGWKNSNTNDYIEWSLTPRSVKDDVCIPYPVLKKIGLSNENQDTLAEMNDKAEASFKDIAAWIKENL